MSDGGPVTRSSKKKHPASTHTAMTVLTKPRILSDAQLAQRSAASKAAALVRSAAAEVKYFDSSGGRSEQVEASRLKAFDELWSLRGTQLDEFIGGAVRGAVTTKLQVILALKGAFLIDTTGEVVPDLTTRVSLHATRVRAMMHMSNLSRPKCEGILHHFLETGT